MLHRHVSTGCAGSVCYLCDLEEWKGRMMDISDANPWAFYIDELAKEYERLQRIMRDLDRQIESAYERAYIWESEVEEHD